MTTAREREAKNEKSEKAETGHGDCLKYQAAVRQVAQVRITKILAKKVDSKCTTSHARNAAS
jgi:hypothetical protein